MTGPNRYKKPDWDARARRDTARTQADAISGPQPLPRATRRNESAQSTAPAAQISEHDRALAWYRAQSR